MKRTGWIIAGIIIVLIIIGGIIFLMRNNGKTAGSTTPSTSTSTKGNSASQAPSQKSGSIIQTKTDSALGSYLTDANGHPLYTYGGDQQGVSNCTGQCLADWPAYTAEATANLPTNVTIITRSDGSKQYAYKGLALYTFLGDSSSQPTGDNVSNFHIAKP